MNHWSFDYLQLISHDDGDDDDHGGDGDASDEIGDLYFCCLQNSQFPSDLLLPVKMIQASGDCLNVALVEKLSVLLLSYDGDDEQNDYDDDDDDEVNKYKMHVVSGSTNDHIDWQEYPAVFVMYIAKGD